MKALCIQGSPRTEGNTEYMLNMLATNLDGDMLRLADYRVEHCTSCWACRETGRCVLNDDMTAHIIPRLLESDVVIIGSPVYFNNVTADVKAFMDRTWCLRGQLRDKIGAGVVVGRRYGAESAITAIHGFFVKHEMIIAHRGVCGLAFEKGAIVQDAEALESAEKLTKRLLSLYDSRRDSSPVFNT